MTKATLEFDLSDPDSKRDFKVATHAESMRSALYEIKEYLRGIDRHGLSKIPQTENVADAVNEVISQIHDKIHEIIYSDNNIDIYEFD